MWRLRKENWLLPSKKVKTKFIYLDDAGNDKLLHWLLLRRLCVYSAGLKVDVSQEILSVVMTSYYENVRSCKRHTVLCRAFCFWQFTLLFLGLATHYCESWYSLLADSYAYRINIINFWNIHIRKNLHLISNHRHKTNEVREDIYTDPIVVQVDII